MAEIKNGAAAVANGAAKKVNRRGVSNKTVAVSNLKFHEKDAAQNGLFIAHLDNVSVDWSQAADGNAFAGLKVPRLTFAFASNHTDVKERRHVYQTLFPVESNVDTIPGGKSDWRVDNVFNWIKHVLDVFYLKGRELTAEEEDALCLPFEDYTENENGNIEYVSIEPEDVVKGYATLFTNAAAMLNGTFGIKDGDTPKPCYKDANGKHVSCWIKLLRAKRVKNEWRNVVNTGDLAFDSFIGAGAIEIVKGSGASIKMPSILRVDFSKESITPKEVKKTPTVGVPNPGMMGGVVVPDATAPMGGSESNAAFNAVDDMPF